MSNELYEHKRSDTVKWVLTLFAFILVGVMLAGVILGWFDKKEEPPAEEEQTEQAAVTDGEGNAMDEDIVYSMPEKMSFNAQTFAQFGEPSGTTVTTREGGYTATCTVSFTGIASSIEITNSTATKKYTSERGEYYELGTSKTYTFNIGLTNAFNDAAGNLSVTKIGGEGNMYFGNGSYNDGGYIRTTLEQRLSARKCELCGSTEARYYEIHHVNKVKNLKGKEFWEQVMIAKRRKTLVLCKECHDKIHGKNSSKK